MRAYIHPNIPSRFALINTIFNALVLYPSFIDILGRYAGWIGTVAARYTTTGQYGKELSPAVSLVDSKHRLAVVAGTSTCHIIQVSVRVYYQLI